MRDASLFPVHFCLLKPISIYIAFILLFRPSTNSIKKVAINGIPYGDISQARNMILSPSENSPNKIIVPMAIAKTIKANMDSSAVEKVHTNRQTATMTVNNTTNGNSKTLSRILINTPSMLTLLVFNTIIMMNLLNVHCVDRYALFI
jgi:hypothetical protein